MINTLLLKNRNKALYEALKVFTVEALQVLAKAVDGGAKVPVLDELAWQQEGEGNSFARRRIVKPMYSVLIHNIRQSI